MKMLIIENHLSVVLFLKTEIIDRVVYEKMRLDFYDKEPDDFSPEKDWVIPPQKQLTITRKKPVEAKIVWNSHNTVSTRSRETAEEVWLSFDKFAKGKN